MAKPTKNHKRIIEWILECLVVLGACMLCVVLNINNYRIYRFSEKNLDDIVYKKSQKLLNGDCRMLATYQNDECKLFVMGNNDEYVLIGYAKSVIGSWYTEELSYCNKISELDQGIVTAFEAPKRYYLLQVDMTKDSSVEISLQPDGSDIAEEIFESIIFWAIALTIYFWRKKNMVDTNKFKNV